jgi:hypothetical protein
VRAAVPRNIDDVVARSVASAARQRSVARVSDAAAFATMVGAAFDHVAPVTSVRAVDASPTRRRARAVAVFFGRLIAVIVAVAVVVGIAWLGLQMITGDPGSGKKAGAVIDEGLLTSPAKPIEEPAVTGVDTPFAITAVRSYDPFGDDNGNGKADKRRGRESEELTVAVNDADPETAWLTSQYASPDLDGKGGVGLIVDLGQPRDVQQVSLTLANIGTNLDVRVSDRIESDPALWTPLASAAGAKDKITLRSPRPVTGRYVLVWISRVPPALTSGAGVYQGGIKTVTVSG